MLLRRLDEDIEHLLRRRAVGHADRDLDPAAAVRQGPVGDAPLDQLGGGPDHLGLVERADDRRPNPDVLDDPKERVHLDGVADLDRPLEHQDQT